ncbi:IS66 family insertion sequence element accessory protein TnpA [Paenibacillus elgii]
MTKRDQRQNGWAKRIEAYKASGLTMVTWCSTNQVNLEQLKYWTRKLKKIASSDIVSSARFIPVTVTELAAPLASSSLVIHVGPASITLQKGFDRQLLREVVEALTSSCLRFQTHTLSIWLSAPRTCVNQSMDSLRSSKKIMA